jgi:hypothetical protein
MEEVAVAAKTPAARTPETLGSLLRRLWRARSPRVLDGGWRPFRSYVAAAVLPAEKKGRKPRCPNPTDWRVRNVFHHARWESWARVHFPREAWFVL